MFSQFIEKKNNLKSAHKNRKRTLQQVSIDTEATLIIYRTIIIGWLYHRRVTQIVI